MFLLVFFFKQKTAYEMRISDWSSDVCSSDLWPVATRAKQHGLGAGSSNDTCPPLRRAGRRLLPDTARSSYSRALALARCAAHSGCVAPCLRPGDLMSHLNTQSRFTSPADFYERDWKSTRLNSSH